MQEFVKFLLWLGIFPPEYVDWLNDDELTSRQIRFLNPMFGNGHTNYCVLRGVSLLHDIEPDVEEV